MHLHNIRALPFAMLVFASFCTELRANFISIQGFVDPANADHGRQIYIKLKINDNNGNPLDVNALVDPGDNGRLDFSAGDGARLGLPRLGDGTVEGAGGEATQTDSFVNGGRNGHVTGETDESPNFKTDVTGSATIGTGDTTTVGTQFFDSDPAGPGEVDLDYNNGIVTIYNHDQALAHSLQKLLQIELLKSPLGDYDSDPNGSAYAVNLKVGSGSFFASSPFVISPGVGRTLISPGFAASLGLTCSGPSETFTSELGRFTVPTANVSLTLFSAQGSQAFQVGCLSRAQDPLNANFLGSDFLSQYNSIYISGATSTFAASVVPEPATLPLVGGCFLALAMMQIRRRRRQAN